MHPPERSATGRHRSTIMGRMGDGVQQTGCQRARVALLTQRVLFGSNPNLYRGNDGVEAIRGPCHAGLHRQFNSPTSGPSTPRRRNQRRRHSTFVVDAAAEPLQVKITWVVIREGAM